ncbi:CocE/NonD family hydrolase [Patulibacter defluvii]|uniref:CocE/NonD family hydrolase n=1 Tax=Patulibacter defluvii TaxID=3095358 RepID=UPI002A75402A|nr:CocE/NonD family hydrolase [Patulibacter sp. DM4]
MSAVDGEHDRGVRVAFDVAARMRDGVTLRADVYRPAAAGRWPTLLTRTPYDKRRPRASATIDPVAAARAGFLVVVQDVRGRFASAGAWEPLRHEREDGFDAVEWAARLPGSNGRVGMYGGSYCGSTQWQASLARPPSLRAIAPLLTWCDPLDGLVARGGARELGLNAWWGLETHLAQLARPPLPSAARQRRRVAAVLDEIDRLATDGVRELPVEGLGPLRRHGARDLGATRRDAEPEVEVRGRVAGAHRQVAVPVLNVGGWHDLFLQGTLDNHVATIATGGRSRLVVGPWGHGDCDLGATVGDLSFGVRGNGLGTPAHPEGDLDDLQLAWFRRHLDPAARTGDDDRPPVRIFTTGRNAWRDEPAWPLPRARVRRWFLAPGGGLAPTPPTGPAAASGFVHDPADPVATVGGAIMIGGGYRRGPLDQARVEARDDVLVFSSAPLTGELEVTGRVRVVLHAESSAPTTDWVARLCDVHPDGRSYGVCDGVVRLLAGADRLRSVGIDLWSASHAFLRGHRLRLQVASSSFPRWDRNLGAGDGPRGVAARQLVHHDGERRSWVELPVVDG